MNFFIRAANGWDITKRSFKVFEANKQLILLPFLSGISLFFLALSFSGSIVNNAIWHIKSCFSFVGFLYLFAFYLLVYFIIVFFNTALSYCVHFHCKGQKVSVIKGLLFCIAHLFSIISWSLFAATIGTVLRTIQNSVGLVGQMFTRVTGSTLGIATYFVVPIKTGENLGPIAALNQSKKIVKEKWGETVGAAFNFVFIQFIALIFIAIIAITIGTIFTTLAGLITGLLGVVILVSTVSAGRIIFLTSVYQTFKGHHVEYFEQNFIDHLIVRK